MSWLSKTFKKATGISLTSAVVAAGATAVGGPGAGAAALTATQQAQAAAKAGEEAERTAQAQREAIAKGAAAAAGVLAPKTGEPYHAPQSLFIPSGEKLLTDSNINLMVFAGIGALALLAFFFVRR